MNDQIVQLAKELISIPSESNNCKEIKKIIDFTKNILDEYTQTNFEKNGSPSLLISNKDKKTQSFKIILNLHLDVVPGNKKQYSPYVQGGKLYGRGSYDMKSAAAAMIIVFKKLAKQVNYPLALQIVIDEETGGFNGTKYQVDQGIRGEYIIAGENTDLKINNSSKGILWVKIVTKGKSGHGAYPWLGKNAIWEMKKNLDRLENTYPIPIKDAWKTTINVATINTLNETTNKIPDECSMNLDIRYIPEDTDLIEQKILKLLSKHTEMKIIVKEPSHFSDPRSKYNKLLLKSSEKITGRKGSFVQKHGGSDVRFFSAVGCEGITFGPIGQGHHSDNEWVDLKSLNDFSQILKSFLETVE